MPREAPQLDRIERWMYTVITHPDGAKAGIKAHSTQNNEQTLKLEQTVLPSDELTALDRISIYANMYFWRLNEIMPTYNNVLVIVQHYLNGMITSLLLKKYITKS